MSDNLIIKDYDLYYNGKVIQFANNEKILVRDIIEYKSTQTDQYHTVQQGDRLTAIAYRYYNKFTSNSSRYWKYIADVNQIMNPLDIDDLIGTDILIPNFMLIKLIE